MRDRLRVERSPTSHSVGRFTLASSSLSRTLSAPLVALNAASVKRNAASHAGGHTGSCTCSLRLIQLPDKPGKIPSFQHVYEGVLPWYRIFSSTSSR
jgi:hypothetical protein